MFKLLSPHTGGQAVYQIKSRDGTGSHIMSNERIRKAQNPPTSSKEEVIVVGMEDSLPLRIEVKRPSKALEEEIQVNLQAEDPIETQSI